MENRLKSERFKSKKILLVDNEKELGWMMKDIMRDAGHRLLYATSFKEGIRKFKRLKNLDVAIIDLKLKDDDGLKFIKKIKGLNGRVRFVMISAFVTPDTKAEARRLGVSYFLDKPLKVENLLGIINAE